MQEPTTPTSSEKTEPDPSPFLKWAGGKRQLLPELGKHMPKGRIDWYIEPFIGGGAVFFDRAYRVDNAVIGDANGELVRTYATVSREVEDVIGYLGMYQNDSEQFYRERARDPKDYDDARRAARFIYLNRVCFNGLYRENQSGKFNTPFGRYKNPTICNAPVLRAASKALARVDSMVEGDFERVVQVALGRRFIDQPGLVGAVIYCDPPYVPLTKSANFTGYQGKGFGPADQVRLRDAALRWLGQGAEVVLSNHDVPGVRDLYGDPERFTIHKVDAKRNINSKADKRGAVGEVIIVGKKGRS